MEYPIQESERRERLIKMLADVATVEGDDEGAVQMAEDAGLLMTLFNPAPNRKAAGEEFKGILGYDPVTYFDLSDIMVELDRVFTRLGRDAQNTIQLKKQEIADRAMQIYDINRSDNLKEALAQALGEFIGEEDADKASIYLTGVAATTKFEPEGASEEEDDDDDEIDVSDLDGGGLDLNDFSGDPVDEDDDYDISADEEDD